MTLETSTNQMLKCIFIAYFYWYYCPPLGVISDKQILPHHSLLNIVMRYGRGPFPPSSHFSQRRSFCPCLLADLTDETLTLVKCILLVGLITEVPRQVGECQVPLSVFWSCGTFACSWHLLDTHMLSGQRSASPLGKQFRWGFGMAVHQPFSTCSFGNWLCRASLGLQPCRCVGT